MKIDYEKQDIIERIQSQLCPFLRDAIRKFGKEDVSEALKWIVEVIK